MLAIFYPTNNPREFAPNQFENDSEMDILDVLLDLKYEMVDGAVTIYDFDSKEEHSFYPNTKDFQRDYNNKTLKKGFYVQMLPTMTQQDVSRLLYEDKSL